MTEAQGWIAIGLLVLIFVQLVQTGTEIAGMRKNVNASLQAFWEKWSGIE
jgi:hypothetical protein